MQMIAHFIARVTEVEVDAVEVVEGADAPTRRRVVRVDNLAQRQVVLTQGTA